MFTIRGGTIKVVPEQLPFVIEEMITIHPYEFGSVYLPECHQALYQLLLTTHQVKRLRIEDGLRLDLYWIIILGAIPKLEVLVLSASCISHRSLELLMKQLAHSQIVELVILTLNIPPSLVQECTRAILSMKRLIHLRWYPEIEQLVNSRSLKSTSVL